MEAKAAYNEWLRALGDDPEALSQLSALSDDQIERQFSGEIVFGTGGLRAELGLGSARMNRHTVARVTAGFAAAILKGDSPKSVAISYDTRHGSAEFAEVSARVLAGYGITAFIAPVPWPTPLLSYAVRHFRLGWGIMITASHNPPQYNGYKAYDHRGVQLVPQPAQTVMDAIAAQRMFSAKPMPLAQAQSAGLVRMLPESMLTDYLSEMLPAIPRARLAAQCGADFPMVYNALHGAGANAVPEALRRLGFSRLQLVGQSADANFGGANTPNPEERLVYAEALELAKTSGARIIMATDPDCDRLGVMVNHGGQYTLLSGNQLGALMIDFLTDPDVVGKPAGDTMITTIVSGDMGEAICRERGVATMRTLTGFKYIGDVAESLPDEGRKFLYGYEESYGCLSGDLARDKDAVQAACLAAVMALYYARRSETLIDRLNHITGRHGAFKERLINVTLTGDDAQAMTERAMAKLREGISVPGMRLIATDDYLTSLHTDTLTGDSSPLTLPREDVLKLWLEGGNWVAARPSGTEPKLKFYMAARGRTDAEAEATLDVLNAAIDGVIKG